MALTDSSKNKISRTSPSQVPRTLGPITDFEKHLPAEWWKTLFNSIYLKTDADVVENARNTALEVDFLLSLTQVEPDDHLLDLCCGQGRHSIELARRGFQFITGIDRSRYLIRLARKRASEANFPIRFSEGDARKIKRICDSIDCVFLMGNSFGYFEQEQDDQAILLAVKNALKSEGKIFMDIVDGDWMRTHFEKRSWEWIDQKLLVCRERMLASDGKRLISREVIVDAEVGVITDQFYAERLYTFAEIEHSLAKVGFIEIQNHGNVQAHSYRNQDLGMMANRFLITALAPAKKRPIKKISPLELPVTVILGDPRLPDQIKNNGKFNQEDLETIHKLKAGLEKVEGYRFSYIDKHANLVRNLMLHPPAYVFNLCDEGFQNDPRKELHVPALLEMLCIPYTGAGPDCLATCYNKSLVSVMAREMGIATPLEIWNDPAKKGASLPSVFPALVKPALGDSSIGITKEAVVHNAEELLIYIEKVAKALPNIPILIQEFLPGREFSVALIGNPGAFEMLPVMEVDYTGLPSHLPSILSYESKWIPDSPYWEKIKYRQAQLDKTKQKLLFDYSTALFERFECHDYARIDFREDAQGTLKLLEINPNPGWCWDGKMNFMAGYAGIHYHELLEKILKAASERWKKVLE